ncbi:MAG: ribonuclease Z [Saprospiraceae bacterium]|nr:ribonuclease Z [Saprospiraceae bacterium]
MGWSLHILGTNAAVPLLDRHPSAQALQTPDEIFLIDCGEATQTRLTEYHIKRSRINHIFISHLHGDHIFGLPGLITSYNLFGRKEPIHIYGPPGLRHYVETINEITGIHLHFDLTIKEHRADISKKILETKNIMVYTLPLNHRVPTTGYLFREKVAKRRIDSEAVAKYAIPYVEMSSIKDGNDWQKPDGNMIPNESLTLPGRQALSFAYCSDTRYEPAIIPRIRNVHLLYHEATFGQDLAEEAHLRGHSTSIEAAQIAQAANVNQLVIGHFSARYKDRSALLLEAQSHFLNTILAKEGLVIPIDNPGELHI